MRTLQNLKNPVSEMDMNDGIPKPFSEAALLEVWEIARQKSRSDRVRALLDAGLKHDGKEQTTQWCIGESDAFLLKLYRSTFGSRLDATTNCPVCGTELELSLEVENLLTEHGSGTKTYQLALPETDQVFHFRLPNRLDFQKLTISDSPESQRQQLVECCVLSVEQRGEKTAPGLFTEKVISSLVEAMNLADPQAEILLDLNCPECRHLWRAQFDIVDFLWQKINTKARRLVMEIHTLAQAYGWTESEILALSENRRRIYLELVSL